jgi:hypothetical protein
MSVLLRTPPRRRFRFAAPLALVVAVAACGGDDSESADVDAKPASESTAAAASDVSTDETSTTMHDHGSGASADDSHDGHDPGSEGGATGPGTVIVGSADGSSPCEVALPAPSSPGQVGTGEGGSDASGSHGHRGMVRQYPVPAGQRARLAEQMRQARAVIDEFPTVATAEAAGYHKSTVYVPCIGAHYTNVARAGAFDATAPSELLYDGTDPDAKIVGLSYLVWHPGGAPEGFAGKNDIWHQHNSNGGLCLKGTLVVGGEAMTEADCEQAGGQKRILEDIWMMHAWVAPGWECSWGVFSGECPELGGRVGGTAFDKPTPDDDDLAVEG